MDVKLMREAFVKYILGLVLVFVLLFFPAGTIRYWNGWLFIGLLFLPMFFLGVALFIKAPDLLQKRLRDKEVETEQKKVVGGAAILFLVGFILAGLNYRYGWFVLPKAVCMGAAIVFLMAYLLYAEELRENTYLSRTIEVQENQKVIDTGLYGIVRHPMYFATVLLFLSMPLILASLQAFIIFLAYPFIIAKRIKHEESFLEKELVGYSEYKSKVKYRMLPYIW